MSELYYFAYGSNMHPARLAARVPSSRAVGAAALDGHALRFHKRSWRDGSGKCNVLATGSSADRVYGVVYVMARGEKSALDAAEGLGRGYEEALLPLSVGGEAIEAFAYRAQHTHIDDGLRPFDWYHRLVVSGARWHGLPEAYVAALERVQTRVDRNRRRRARHLAIIAEG